MKKPFVFTYNSVCPICNRTFVNIMPNNYELNFCSISCSMVHDGYLESLRLREKKIEKILELIKKKIEKIKNKLNI